MKLFGNFSLMKLKEGFEEDKQSVVNSLLPLPKREISSLGWGIIMGMMSLLILPIILDKFSVSLPVVLADPVWKLLFQRGVSLIMAAVIGIVLGGLSQVDLSLKTLKILDKIFLFVVELIIRVVSILCLVCMAMKCSLTEFKQSAYFDWVQADGWLCEGTLILIINSIIWLLVLSLITYVTSRSSLILVNRLIWKEQALKQEGEAQ